MKAGKVEPQQKQIARQQRGKHVSAATNTYATEETLETVFSMRLVSGLYNEDQS
jgi:hypothetical protein